MFEMIQRHLITYHEYCALIPKEANIRISYKKANLWTDEWLTSKFKNNITIKKFNKTTVLQQNVGVKN